MIWVWVITAFCVGGGAGLLAGVCWAYDAGLSHGRAMTITAPSRTTEDRARALL